MPLKSITKGEGNVLKIATAQRRPIKFTVSFYVRLTGLPPGAVDKGDQAIIEQQLLLCCRDFYASRCDTACRRGHEFGSDRIGNGFAQDPIDLGLG